MLCIRLSLGLGDRNTANRLVDTGLAMGLRVIKIWSQCYVLGPAQAASPGLILCPRARPVSRGSACVLGSSSVPGLIFCPGAHLLSRGSASVPGLGLCPRAHLLSWGSASVPGLGLYPGVWPVSRGLASVPGFSLCPRAVIKKPRAWPLTRMVRALFWSSP